MPPIKSAELSPTEREDEFSAWLASCANDALRFVKTGFPWGMEGGQLENFDGPDAWQAEILEAVSKGILNINEAVRIAVASGHGVGKSGLVAWLILWGLSTFPDTRGVVTAETETQLRTKTWAELGKWHRLFCCQHWFHFTATSLYSANPDHEKTWRVDAIPWSEHNPQAFAGLHNQGKRVLLIFDEASEIDDKIWEVAENALTDAGTELIWCVFGNPTKNTGRFRECFGRFRHRWRRWQVDSRKAKLTNKEEQARKIADYGEDSDYVRVRVKGEFPRGGSMQFIDGDAVEQARLKEPMSTLMDPFVYGVDIARFGDDSSIICKRRGRDAASMPWIKFRNVDTMTVAARIAEEYSREKPDAIFIDGGGVGGGVVDRCRQLGLPIIEVQFGGKPDRAVPTKESGVVYANKRAEIWGYMKDWLPYGAIPDDAELIADLVGVEYGYRQLEGRDAIQLESKADMKARGLASPDCFVAETMIATPSGLRAIETLKIGDPVSTPFGPSPVIARWESNAVTLTTARFSNGSTLVGKGKHEVFAWGLGKVRLDALPLTIEIETDSRWRRALWATASMFFTEARNIGFKAAVDILARESALTASVFCTAAFGWTIAALSRRAITSTTRTMIGATARLRIWNSSRALAIAGITCRSGYATLRMPREMQNTWNEPALPPLSGMAHPKAAHGMRSTVRKPGKDESPLALSVNAARHHSGHSSRPAPASAPGVASKQPHTSAIRTILAPVIGAAKRSLRIAIGLRAVVPVSVRTANVQPTNVYNLTLAQHNAYYANGILVFNCGDALALTFSYPIMPRDHTKDIENQGAPRHQYDYDPLSREAALPPGMVR